MTNKSRHPLVIGNWKMNPQSVTLATRLAADVAENLAGVRGVEVVIAPPFTYLQNVQALGAHNVLLGAQNMHHEKLGAHTGEISLPMLKSFGVTHVILGHSERRAAGETNADVAQKIEAALKGNMRPVVCVGERTRDQDGHYLTFIEEEVRSAFAGVSKAKLSHMTIAYEPIWAIGTGNNATPEDAHEVKIFIQKVLTDLFGRTGASSVRILYGGSVTAKNANELMANGRVDGFLVGGSSLQAEEFAKIVKAAQAYA